MARRRSFTLASFITMFLLITMTVQLASAQEKARGKGVLKQSYHEVGGKRPEWVTAATDRSLSFFSSKGNAAGDLQLRSAEQDDIATHVRLDQFYKGVPVFGGQLVSHIDAAGNIEQSGDFFAVNLDVKPTLSADQAIAAAKGQLAYKAALPEAPAARLVILPELNVLAYQVSIHIEDGTDATAHHEYFINAKDGSLASYYNDIDTANATGTGKSLYSGNVTLTTDLLSGVYYLRDNTRGGAYVVDMNNRTNGNPTTMTDSDNIWGTNTSSSRQSAAVDAQYGATLTWDYYLNNFGRRGIDGNGFRVPSRVHYGSRYNNAFWNGSSMTYGDGDGTTFTPLVSLDVAGHEITHGLTEKTAGLIYSKESGALNESMSDIFGTLIEYSRTSKPGNYLIGEEIYTPGTSGDALRNMANPAAAGDPDHYSKRLYPGTCSPSSSNDNCGVHTNSSISNQAFYLLAEGGTNRTSNLSVTGIGRSAAGAIFYRALTVYMGPSTTFLGARTATLNAARDLYGTGSAQYNAVAQAWSAVGVQ
ncbi:MAG TPA: M4 family metallopeptidase [Herpetosiphonaceae bacterium]